MLTDARFAMLALFNREKLYADRTPIRHFWEHWPYAAEASSGGSGGRSGDPTTDPNNGDGNGGTVGNERP